MDHQFVSSLMENNDRARAQALELSSEVQRLRKRETELATKTQAVLQALLPVLAEKETTAVNAFQEWIMLFRVDADGPRETSPSPKEEEEAGDPRQMPYTERGDEHDEEAQSRQSSLFPSITQLVEELRLLQRLKRREPLAWLDAAQRGGVGDENSIAEWEARNKCALPHALRQLYLAAGAFQQMMTASSAASSSSSYAYSPLLALLPLSHVGWTEVYGDEAEVEDESQYRDDAVCQQVLERFDAGHEFEDDYVCQQLCGGEGEAKSTRVLLVGAPMDCAATSASSSSKQRNSRMYVNIRPSSSEADGFVGDGLLYRLDCFGESGDSELVRVGTAWDWLEQSFRAEAELRLSKGDPGQLVAKRYPRLMQQREEEEEERRKRQREEDEEEGD